MCSGNKCIEAQKQHLGLGDSMKTNLVLCALGHPCSTVRVQVRKQASKLVFMIDTERANLVFAVTGGFGPIDHHLPLMMTSQVL